MQIKKLIEQLEQLYSTYDQEYKDVMGEPEIMIDTFKLAGCVPSTHHRTYAGYSDKIIIDKTTDGVYAIINGFYEDHLKTKEATKLTSGSPAWPQVWRA